MCPFLDKIEQNLPIRAMRYTSKDARKEVEQLAQAIIKRASHCLETEDCRELVGILLELDNESAMLALEARRLRLEGKLDLKIYSTLSDGYAGIKERVLDLAGRYGVLRQVRSLYNFNKHMSGVMKHACTID
jgi:hypothetical protein